MEGYLDHESDSPDIDMNDLHIVLVSVVWFSGGSPMIEIMKIIETL